MKTIAATILVVTLGVLGCVKQQVSHLAGAPLKKVTEAIATPTVANGEMTATPIATPSVEHVMALEYIAKRVEITKALLEKETRNPKVASPFIVGNRYAPPEKTFFYFLDGRERIARGEGIPPLIPVLKSLESVDIDLTPIRFREWDGSITHRVLIAKRSEKGVSGIRGKAHERRNADGTVVRNEAILPTNFDIKPDANGIFWLWIDCATYHFNVTIPGKKPLIQKCAPVSEVPLFDSTLE